MDVRSPRAWVLNFDAEAELEDPSAHTSSRAVRERSRALVERVQGLLGPGDVVVPEGAERSCAGFRGRAWCPTPRALDALARAGAVPPHAPPVAVLRRANHRGFCAELGQSLPGARFVTARGELDETLAGPSPTGRWVLKRPLGFAGRGRLVIAPGALTDAEVRWIEASLARDGLQVEPWVERLGDYGLHGYLSAAGEISLGAITAQECDARGAWRSTVRAPPGALDHAEERALVDAAIEAAHALSALGYFGPFGVDAFRFRDAEGRPAWNPRCEINARYSMGWATGVGPLRPDLDE